MRSRRIAVYQLTITALAPLLSSQTPPTPPRIGMFIPEAKAPTVLEWWMASGRPRWRVRSDAQNIADIPTGSTAWFDAVSFPKVDVLVAGSDHHLVAAIDWDGGHPKLLLSELRRTDGVWSRTAAAHVFELRQLDRQPPLIDMYIQTFTSAAILSWSEETRSLHLLVDDSYMNADPFKPDEPDSWTAACTKRCYRSR